MKIRRSRADFPYGLTRRELFRTTTAAACLSMGALDTRANPLGLPIGCQTYPVRHKIATDFPGTIQLLAAAGVQTIELCSPQGYAKAGFAAVAQYKGAALPRLLGNLNVKCQSSYFSTRELREDL